MTASEIQTVATATSADSEAAATDTTDDDWSVTAPAAQSASEADHADRVCLDILSREPVLRFTEDTDSGALRTVSVDAATGATTPLTSGISPLDLTREILESAPDIALAAHPILRERPGEAGEPGHVDVVDPQTGEIVDRVAANDFFDLDVAVREFSRKSLVDKSA